MVNTVIDPLTLPEGPLALPATDEPGFALWQLLESVCDPEIPVLSLREIGVLRAVHPGPSAWRIYITPTYNGCPAISQMQDDIQTCLQQAGYHAEVINCLSPAWSSEWITLEGKNKLHAYGIAPPHAIAVPAGVQHIKWVPANTHRSVACPQCGSANTTETSHFGSTACKAMYKCLACMEPFDYFKPY
jgi:ring-1,2-phenylacetyl-CoA epoxidase subunit PaaD